MQGDPPSAEELTYRYYCVAYIMRFLIVNHNEQQRFGGLLTAHGKVIAVY